MVKKLDLEIFIWMLVTIYLWYRISISFYKLSGLYSLVWDIKLKKKYGHFVTIHGEIVYSFLNHAHFSGKSFKFNIMVVM